MNINSKLICISLDPIYLSNALAELWASSFYFRKIAFNSCSTSSKAWITVNVVQLFFPCSGRRQEISAGIEIWNDIIYGTHW